ncbi:MFS siderophore iron transporter, putative [Talaromyces stipitatus ATCC 10500]|uniref:MFS siderophore iron transporter, putative n=1 Tax=Talaromyces stipitatus (strain ATCC 10500 / CBS 375.48 / QM 6759 / NRRL 1006) TaxID=441959 RepID=B8MMM6_TALSN|nr:MFS siderophore iron transporter, putative [Talaromyces stipitatus ATCC 10500]EED13781.1 MFS siderophore iron transporter, putative [Talaromyces stipitatus ATCC 10500]
MGKLPNIQATFRRATTDDTINQASMTTTDESKTDPTTVDNAAANKEAGELQTEVPGENLQHGVKSVEAITLSWSKASLIAIFINIWLLYFVNAFQSSILASLIPFVTSAFSSHSLLNVIYIVGDAMSAAVFIPLAKILDVWGRAEGFLIMTVCCTLGLVLMASCNDLSTFCAAYVFYTIGFSGVTYCVDVITADASKLKNRGLAYAFTSSPYIITAFAGPKASNDFYYKISWRWGFGCFSIIFPVVAAPIYFVLKRSLRNAQKRGLLPRENSGRTWLQSIWYYIVEFDVLGVILFSAGLTVFFLPFDLSSYAPDGWSSGYIIAMIVVGLVLLIIFAFYEWLLAPKPMFNFSFLADRTVIGACLLDATYQISYYCWNNYFTSFLQVVNDLSIDTAGYVNNTFNVVSGLLLLLVGYLIRRTGRFKWLLYIAVPLYVFTQGLMIYFRRPNQSVGYLVMCQIFISIGGSIFIIVQQIAIEAAVDHQHVAAVLALLNVVGTVGGAIGSTVCGSIWSHTFPDALARYLPNSALADFDDIYENLDTQLSYPTRMLAAGTGIMALGFIWIFLFKNINLAKKPQVKGMVF